MQTQQRDSAILWIVRDLSVSTILIMTTQI